MSRRKACFLAAACCLLSCSEPTGVEPIVANPTDPPNIIIVLIDTLRADHTSVGGYRRDTTPNLRRIADAGLVLSRHYANAPWTKASVASMLTGLHPSAHRSRSGRFETLSQIEALRSQGRDVTIETLSPRLSTLPEMLGRAGYFTTAFVSNYHLTPKFGYQKGYDEYNFRVGMHNDESTIASTIEALQRGPEPVFIWSHLMFAHQYWYPEEFAKFSPETATAVDPAAYQAGRMKAYDSIEAGIAAYDNSILYVDSLVGRLFDFILESAPNTILIVTSDHGEEFNEHGGYDHAHTLYNEILHVPFVAWGPTIPRGTAPGITDSLDLLPTLLANVGAAVPEGLDGDVIWRDEQWLPAQSDVFAEQHHLGPDRRYSLQRGGMKLIMSENKPTGEARLEFYPNVLATEHPSPDVPEEPDEIAAMHSALLEYRDAAEAQFHQWIGEPELTALDDEDIEQFKALGYVETDEAPAPAAPGGSSAASP